MAKYGVQLSSGEWFEVELKHEPAEWDIDKRFLDSSDWMAATNQNSPGTKFKIRANSIVAFYKKEE